jgi:hypothetical protein
MAKRLERKEGRREKRGLIAPYMGGQAMKAGRELDALIAEKVMGWVLPPHSSVVGQMWVETPSGRVHPKLPEFSSNISDAWQVVEKMKEIGYMMWLEQEGVYQCVFFRGLGYQVHDYSVASSAPLAICLAAIKAKGIDIDVKRTKVDL